ncbi:MAG: hypothetical protein ACI9FJ_002035 [Alteromonadaceae bacterium]|jgi:hypothetical protein
MLIGSCLIARLNLLAPYQHLTNHPVVKNYHTFAEQVGMKQYSQIVKTKLEKLLTTPFIAIGESVGATALWCNTPNLNPQHCLGAFCLYGSRIRDYLTIKPACYSQLVFSQDESYFLTKQVNHQLSSKPTVFVSTVDLQHGFASPGHHQFNPQAFAEVIKTIKALKY